MSEPVKVRISRFNLLLIIAIAFGFGSVWAYQIFYSAWKSKCHEMLTEQEGELMAKLTTAAGGGGDAVAVSKRELQESEQMLFQLQGSIQRYNHASTVNEFGPAPYVVIMRIAFDGDKDNANNEITIEFRELEDMPHTVATFLSLINQGLYVGTTLGVEQQHNDDSSTQIVVGGDPHSVSSGRTRQQLVRRYHELGYGTMPLWIHEVSNNMPCLKNGVQFLQRGPRFAIRLRNQRNDVGDVSCPGRVVSGTEIFSRLTQEHATIVETHIVGTREEDVGDEL